MSRPAVALVALILFIGLVFGLRMWSHRRRTGSTGFRGISGRPGSLEWSGGVLFVAGLVLTTAAPIARMAGLVGPLVRWPGSWVDAVAASLVVIGAGGTMWSQAAMGASWRIGVRENEQTALVRYGPFRWVRNPVFSFVLLSVTGFVLYLADVLSVAGLATMWVAIELQVRFVEEPYLRSIHGESYDEYCRRVGRFIPGVGKARKKG